LYKAVVFTRTVVIFFCMLGAGCSSPATHRSAPAPTVASCVAPNRFGAVGAPNEIHVAAAAAQLWGLALGPGRVPPRVGDELKIVWHMTGTGPLRVVFRDPGGRVQPLVFGPERHGSSSDHRPGDEWGTGFRFPTRGCWHIHLARNDATADVRLVVH
jgi:hypothetical protein